MASMLGDLPWVPWYVCPWLALECGRLKQMLAMLHAGPWDLSGTSKVPESFSLAQVSSEPGEAALPTGAHGWFSITWTTPSSVLNQWHLEANVCISQMLWTICHFPWGIKFHVPTAVIGLIMCPVPVTCTALTHFPTCYWHSLHFPKFPLTFKPRSQGKHWGGPNLGQWQGAPKGNCSKDQLGSFYKSCNCGEQGDRKAEKDSLHSITNTTIYILELSLFSLFIHLTSGSIVTALDFQNYMKDLKSPENYYWPPK